MFDNILSDLIITKVRSATTMYNPKNKKTQKKDRPYWAIVIKYEGETEYTCGEKCFRSNATHLMILPKGSSYDFECIKAGHFSIIEFESEQTFSEPMVFSVKSNEKILKIFDDIEHRKNLKEPFAEIESIKDVYSIILELARSDSDKYTPSSKREKIMPALEYISQNYNKQLSNETLADITGISEVYFRKLFKEIMGMSAMNYAKQLRIDKAKEMLKSDYSTVGNIAFSLGYSSLYDFSRDFKKHTGVAPSKYEGR